MERKKMKKLRKAVSLVAVMAIMATMFAAPLGVNAADENIAYTYSGKISPGSSNGAPSTFSKFTGESVTAENGTLKTPKEYYYTGKNLYGGAGDMTVGYVSNGSDGGKSVITFNDLYSDFVKDADSNTRIVYEININPIKQINNITLLMRDAGVSITKSLVTNFDYGKWTNIKIYYNPTVKYKYTKTTGTTSEIKEVTTNSLTNFLIANNTSSATNINNYWKGLLGSEYDENSSYAFNSATYGDCDVYVDGIYKGNISGLTNSSNPRHVSATIPGRISFNAASTALFYSNASVKVIKNCTPSASAMSPFTNESKDGKYVSDTNNIYIKEGTKLSDITLNDGYEMAAYTDMTAGGTYPTVPADGVLAENNAIVVRDSNYQMRTYSVKPNTAITMYQFDGSTDLGLTKNVIKPNFNSLSGKTSDDKSYQLPLGDFDINGVSTGQTDLAKLNGYVKMSMNVLTAENSENAKFTLKTVWGNSISDPVDASRLNGGQWNHLDFIISLKGNTTDDRTNASVKTYINGKQIGQQNGAASPYGTYLQTLCGDNYKGTTCEVIRMATSNFSGDKPLYIDDIKITMHKLAVYPETMPTAITAADGDQVATVTAKGARVYTDRTYSTQLTDGTIKAGNIIVTEQNGLYAYYTVQSKYTENDYTLMTITSPLNMGNVKVSLNWSQSGIGGKSIDDYSLKMTSDGTAQDGYLTFEYKRATENYLVFKFNLLIPSTEKNLGRIFIGENSHNAISADIRANDISRDEWHEVTNIIEYPDYSSKAKYTTYLDGSKLRDGETVTNDLTKGNNRQLRIISWGNDKDNPKATEVYFDDFVIYRSNTAPTVAPQELTNTFDGDIKVADGNTMYIPAGATVAQAKAIIKGKYTAAAVKAINGYKISGNTVLADDATLTDGDIIVYETTDNGVSNAGLKTYSYVTVKSLPSSGIIAEKSSVKATDTATAHAITTESGYTFVAAEYDKDGNMVQVDYNTNSTISLTTKTAGNTVKLFLIDGFGNLKPLAENVEIAVK